MGSPRQRTAPRSSSAEEWIRAEKRRRRGIVLIAGLLLAPVLWLSSIVESNRWPSPDGRYEVITSTRRYESLIPRMPGQGSDKPGFVTIVSREGECFGSIPVDMLWFAASIEWSADGAEIPGVGEWNFSRRTVSYWNESRTRTISEDVR